jgi:anti-anti-sigma factor
MLKPSIETRNISGILVAEFWDCLRLDPAPVQDLRKHYESHVQGNGRPDLVVDLSGVGFAGSAALGNFVALQRMVRHGGGRFLFCNVDPTVSEVFRASKLESLFEFVPDRPSAVRAIVDGQTAEPVKKPPSGNDGSPADKLPKTGRAGSGPLRRRNHGPESA